MDRSVNDRCSVGAPRVLVVGTADTKSDELRFIGARIEDGGGVPVFMDVGVLAAADFAPDIDHHAVARAGGTTIEALRGGGDENRAMTAMASGAASIAKAWHAQGRIDGALMLGGTMGTDLALDVAAALPPGVPKVVVSTVAHSVLIPPERVAPDLVMVLWAGGLYGLNALCRATLSQAAGAVLGACRAARAEPVETGRPLIGVTSFGTSCLRYVVPLKTALEARGYDVAVFHTTGMGGRAFERLAEDGRFAAVFDFSLQELSNHLGGSTVSAGPDRLRGAGRAGVPQLVAPGAIDMIDFPTHSALPERLQGRPVHDHNRLIRSATLPASDRVAVVREIVARLHEARGPVHLLVPAGGLHAWDRPGEPLHDPEGLAATLRALREGARGLPSTEVDAHVNDPGFVRVALDVFDAWVREGRVVAGRPGSPHDPAPER
jgi:uncharacterized protein (UPF0261 family)